MMHEVIRITVDAEAVNQRMQQLLDDEDAPTLCFLFDERDGCWRATAMWDNNEGVNFCVDAVMDALLTGLHASLREAVLEGNDE